MIKLDEKMDCERYRKCKISYEAAVQKILGGSMTSNNRFERKMKRNLSVVLKTERRRMKKR